MTYYSTIFRLETGFPPKYFVKHCQDKKEYLDFLESFYKEKNVEKITTVVDEKDHWRELDYLVGRITKGIIDEEFFKKGIRFIQDKIKKKLKNKN